MRGVNLVILAGNLGADPESRVTAGGTVVCNFRIATSESWKDKQTGEQQERTEWHSIVAFGRLAEVAIEYLRKGSKVYLQGKIRTQKWQDRDGKDRYTTKIYMDELQILDSKTKNSGGTPTQRPEEPQSKTPVAKEEFDDDIPW